MGYHPEVILAGRRINDGMGRYVVGQLVKAMIKKKIQVGGARVLVMGLAFKENCPDLRNTRVVDVVKELGDYGALVDVYDPWVDEEEAKQEYQIDLVSSLNSQYYDAVVVAVAHSEFCKMGAGGVVSLCKDEHVVYDLKRALEDEGDNIRL